MANRMSKTWRVALCFLVDLPTLPYLSHQSHFPVIVRGPGLCWYRLTVYATISKAHPWHTRFGRSSQWPVSARTGQTKDTLEPRLVTDRTTTLREGAGPSGSTCGSSSVHQLSG